MEGFGQQLGHALSEHHAHFVQALSGLETSSDRNWFAHVLLGRLLLIYDLQVAGFLGRGDRWYLHNHLSEQSTQEPDSFFQQFLQPLCHQGLGLPPSDRSQPLQRRLGEVPYLDCNLFQTHPLEQQYQQIDIPDEPLEHFLGWLAEYPWQRTNEVSSEDSDVISRWTLAAAYEHLITEQTGKAIISTAATLDEVCRQTIEAHLLSSIKQRHDVQAETLPEVLSQLNGPVCELLVTQVLPGITVLDPACGSGRYLLVALERLQGVYQACWQFAQTSPSPQLQGWVRSLAAPQWHWTQSLLTHNLYGVDLLPEAITITQLQLWLQLLSTALTQDDLAVLPDLDFNITQGNALVGFIRVDEESFDKVTPKRLRPSQETILQGNLLQPLAAANYRDTLTEKKIRVEHYQLQTKAMGQEGRIPKYAQTEFLRDRIEVVNQAAQQKLDGLLFETFSRKLGIQVKEPQASGRTRKRLLTLADVEALSPLHWGFFFNRVMEQQGGFDVILTHAPEGTLKPRADEFYHQHAALLREYKIEPTIFRRSHRQILQQFPELASLWGIYAGRIAALRDYVRRSDDYQLPSTTAARRSIAFKTLLKQRCELLTKPDSVPPYVH